MDMKSTPTLRHDWRPELIGSVFAMTCGRSNCPVIWWPDRHEPKSSCIGNTQQCEASRCLPL